jgi:hypothetical protein
MCNWDGVTSILMISNDTPVPNSWTMCVFPRTVLCWSWIDEFLRSPIRWVFILRPLVSWLVWILPTTSGLRTEIGSRDYDISSNKPWPKSWRLIQPVTYYASAFGRACSFTLRSLLSRTLTARYVECVVALHDTDHVIPCRTIRSCSQTRSFVRNQTILSFFSLLNDLIQGLWMIPMSIVSRCRCMLIPSVEFVAQHFRFIAIRHSRAIWQRSLSVSHLCVPTITSCTDDVFPPRRRYIHL